METELARYRAEEAKKEAKQKKKVARKKKFINILCFALSLFWKVAIIVGLIIVAVILEKKYDSNVPLYVFGAVDFVGLGITIYVTIKSDVSKYLRPKSTQEKTQDKDKESEV